MTNSKPFAPSAERNKQAILDVLEHELADHDHVLEYGSGTAQHIVHFAKALPSVHWIPSDLPEQLPGIRQWIEEARCPNILQSIELDLRSVDIPNIEVTACYTANTFHIVSWQSVQHAFSYSAALLSEGEKFLCYGPFSKNGKHNSQGNSEFDKQLRANNSKSGIRDLIELDALATHSGFVPLRAIPMPANNQLLVWMRDKSCGT